MDGEPFADTQASLFVDFAVLNPVVFDENGLDIRSEGAMTGTSREGALLSNCLDWTSASTTDQLFGGNLADGPSTWVAGFGTACEPHRLICMGRSQTATLAVSVAGDRKIWLSNSACTIGAGQTPDQKCQSERPPGLTNARALLATTESAASSVLDMAAVYTRPDGIRVGTGAQLALGGVIDSGLWQAGDFVYGINNEGFARIWTGQEDLVRVGTDASTCSNWTDATGTDASTGRYLSTRSTWWSVGTSPCTEIASLYCVSVP